MYKYDECYASRAQQTRLEFRILTKNGSTCTASIDISLSSGMRWGKTTSNKSLQDSMSPISHQRRIIRNKRDLGCEYGKETFIQFFLRFLRVKKQAQCMKFTKKGSFSISNENETFLIDLYTLCTYQLLFPSLILRQKESFHSLQFSANPSFFFVHLLPDRSVST